MSLPKTPTSISTSFLSSSNHVSAETAGSVAASGTIEATTSSGVAESVDKGSAGPTSGLPT